MFIISASSTTTSADIHFWEGSTANNLGIDEWNWPGNWASDKIPPQNGANTRVILRGDKSNSRLRDFLFTEVLHDYSIESLELEAVTTDMTISGGDLTVSDYIANRSIPSGGNDGAYKLTFRNNVVIGAGTGGALHLTAFGEQDFVYDDIIFEGANASLIGGADKLLRLTPENQGRIRMNVPIASTFLGDIEIFGGEFYSAGHGDPLSGSTRVSLFPMDPAAAPLEYVIPKYVVDVHDNIGSLAGNVFGGKVVLNQNLGVGFDNTSSTFYGEFTGAGQLTKSGSGTFTVRGSSIFFAGDVEVRGTGTMEIAGGNARFKGDSTLFTLFDEATLKIGQNLTIGGLEGDSGTVDLGNQDWTLKIGQNNQSTTFAGSLAGAGNLLKWGNGRFTLTGSNDSFTGKTVLEEGEFEIAGDPNNSPVGDSAQIELNGGRFIINASETIGGLSGDADGVLELNQPLTVGADGSTTNYGGSVVGSSLLIKSGAGEFTLTRAGEFNTGEFYSGTILVSEGTLRVLGSQNAIGDATTVVVAAGSTFEVDKDETVGNLSGIGGSGGVTQLNFRKQLTLGGDDSSATYSGDLRGSGTLVKEGAGTFTLAGQSGPGFVGWVVIKEGTVEIDGVGQALGSSSKVNVRASGTLLFNKPDSIGLLSGEGSLVLNADLSVGRAAHSNFLGAISGTGKFTKTGTGLLILGGPGTWTGGTEINNGFISVDSVPSNLGSGGIRLDGGTLKTTATHSNSVERIELGPNGGTIEVDAGTTFVMTSAVDVWGAGTLTKKGAGVLNINQISSYGGATLIEEGDIRLGNSGTLPDASTVEISAEATWNVNGKNDLVKSIRGTGSIRLGTGSLTVDSDDGTAAFDGVISETGTLTKSGANTVVLTGSNTYSGGTTITEGKLLANNASGSATGGGFVNVLNGATLGGNGSVNGMVTVDSGGTLAPGTSPGKLTVGSAIFNAGSTLAIEIGGLAQGIQYDLLEVIGNLDLDGSTLEASFVDSYSPSIGQSFTIIDVGGSLTGTFAGVAEGESIGEFGAISLSITYSGGDGNDVALLALPALPGDFDLDEDVDGFDFLKWQQGESPNLHSPSDLLDWETNYGAINSLAASHSVAVAEPTGALLVTMCLIVAARSKRSSHRPAR